MRTIAMLTISIAFASIAQPARADDAENLETHDRKGYFDKSNRLGLYYFQSRGSRPADQGFGDAGDFKRSGFGAEFDSFGFWDATRFDTLIGAEFKAKVGLHRAEVLKDPQPGRESVDENRIFLRLDGACDYGLLHWDGAIKGRISGGAGFGFDFDGGRSYAAWRAYPLLLARVQLWPGDAFSLNGAYYYVPATGNQALTIREHRFEGSIGISALQVGLRFELTTVKREAAPDGTAIADYIDRVGSVFAAFAF